LKYARVAIQLTDAACSAASGAADTGAAIGALATTPVVSIAIAVLRPRCLPRISPPGRPRDEPHTLARLDALRAG
jgi:hypothetical protein